MSQIVPGIFVGNGVYLLRLSGDPTAPSSVNDESGSFSAAGVGSVFLRTDAPDTNHLIYVLGPNGWAAK